MIASSPDEPESIREKDYLRRWALAQTIYDLICGRATADWSIRVGIYGGWGQGKTTILKFIHTLAIENKYPVAWFNPWNSEDRLQLWISFYISIRETFPTSGPLGQFGDWFRQKGSIPHATKLLQLTPKTKSLGEMAVPFLMKRVKSNVEELLNQLPKDKKLIVIVDDLDRASPDLVPHLLIGLRETFNFKKCIYLLGLDPEIVAKSLPKVHPGWGSTPEFLEKIIDFPFWLSPAKQSDLLLLTENELSRSPFQIDRHAFDEIIDLMPDNPRKLKQFIRGLWRFDSVIRRHEPGEINWILLLLIELVRTLLPGETNRLFVSESFRTNLLVSQFRSRSSRVDSMGAPAVDKWQEDLDSIFPQYSDRNLEKRKQLERIIEAIRDRTSLSAEEQIYYWAFVGDDPPTFTTRELRSLFDLWDRDPTKQQLETLVSKHMDERGLTSERVIRDLFRTSIQSRDYHLSIAADVGTEENTARETRAADSILSMLRTMVSQLHVFKQEKHALDFSDFKLLYQHCHKWAHFTNLDIYVKARSAERILLEESARDGTWFAGAVIEYLMPWMPPRGMTQQGNDLQETVTEAFTPIVLADLRERFSRKEGIASLWGQDRHLVQKYFLFKQNSGFYSPETVEDLQAIAVQAKDNEIIQDNFLEFLGMLAFGLRNGLNPLSINDLDTLAKDHGLMSAVWNAATSRKLQPRTWGSIKEARRILVNASGREETFAVPQWWEKEAPEKTVVQATTPLSDLAKEAKQLLVEASEAPDGTIKKIRTSGGLMVEANGKNFVEGQNPRSAALWEDAIRQLQINGLVEDRGREGRVFGITNRGYQVVEAFRKLD